MDVAKPGALKNGAAGARPVIVTNRVVVQDPMVKQDAAKDGDTGTAPVSHEKTVIKPLEPELSAARKEGLLDIPFDIDEEADKADTAANDGSATPQADAELPAEENAPDEESEAPADNDAAVIGRGKPPAQEETDAKTLEEHDRLVDEKTYFLPINAAEHRRSKIVGITGVIVILLLALAWVNIALDAGLIEIPGVHSVTHFFK